MIFEDTKFDKYFNQLKDALTIFLNTNDPSKLFRRTRVLLTKSTDNPPPLNTAIERGHIHLALPLIEQVIDMSPSNGLLEKMNDNNETPLLVAAKYNHMNLIETILKNRSDLAKQKDKDGNNIFHLLANVNDDKGAESIKNIFEHLSNDMKVCFMKEKNQNDQTPLEIAQSQGNIQCIALLEAAVNIGQNNH